MNQASFERLRSATSEAYSEQHKTIAMQLLFKLSVERESFRAKVHFLVSELDMHRACR